MTAPGSMSAHDDLCEAYMAFVARASTVNGRRLMNLAEHCGMAASEPFPLLWIKRRIKIYRQEAAAPELAEAGVMALEAIDNILPAHRGQHEYAQLLEAFNALQAAITKAEGPTQRVETYRQEIGA